MKYTEEDAKKWNIQYFDENYYNDLAKEKKNNYIDAMFLIRGVTDYLNTFFNQGSDLEPSEVEDYIFDSTAYKTIIKHDDSLNVGDDLGIDALIMFDDENILIKQGDEVAKVNNIVVFQSKNGGNDTVKSAFMAPIDGFKTIIERNDPRLDDNLTFRFIEKTLGVERNRKIKNANVYTVLLTSKDSDKRDIMSWLTAKNNDLNDLKQLGLHIPLDDPNIIKKSMVFAPNELLDTRHELEQQELQNHIQMQPFDKELKVINLDYQSFYSDKVSVFTGFSYLRDYVNFLNNENQFFEKLVSDNVRGYQGNSLANKSLHDTLMSSENNDDLEIKALDEMDFWWLNNGITIIVNSISQKSPISFSVKNPQIVNGQQTSRKIYELKDNLRNNYWKVQLKIVVINSSDDVAKKIKEMIILGVNTQNKVEISSILGLDTGIRNLASAIAEQSNNKHHLIIRKGEQLKINSGTTYPYEFILQMIIASIYKMPGEARNSISKVTKNYFDDVFLSENTNISLDIVNAWINFIEVVDFYDKCYKQATLNKTLGDQYAYLAIFSIIVNYVNDLSTSENLIDQLKSISLDNNSFTTAIDKWHTFIETKTIDNMGSRELSSYLRSRQLSLDLREHFTENAE